MTRQHYRKDGTAQFVHRLGNAHMEAPGNTALVLAYSVGKIHNLLLFHEGRAYHPG